MEVCVEAHPLVLFWVYGYLAPSPSRDKETCPGQRECCQLCFHTVIGLKFRRPTKIEQQECVVLSLFETNDCDCSTAALRATHHKLRQRRKRDDFVTRPSILFMAGWTSVCCTPYALGCPGAVEQCLEARRRRSCGSPGPSSGISPSTAASRPLPPSKRGQRPSKSHDAYLLKTGPI